MNARLDRLESQLSQPFKESIRPERMKASSSRDSPTQTGYAAEHTKTLIMSLLALFILSVAFCAGMTYLDKRREPLLAAKAAAKNAEKRRLIAEAVAERLAADFGIGCRPLVSEQKSGSAAENER